MHRNEALNRLIDMQMSFLKSACLYVATKLEVANFLANGPKSVDEIAAATSSNSEYLYRVLRYLSGQGLFEEQPDRVFRLTAMSELLRTDCEGSFHPFTLINSEWGFEAILELLSGVKEGRIPFVKRFGKHPFEYMQEKPEFAALMERAWQGVHWPETDAFLDAYDFNGVQKLADIGGGHGDVIVGFLERDDRRSGALFDIPPVASLFEERMARLGLEKRCEAIGGDFFQAVPVKADAYFMRHIIHDWNDQECVKILRNVGANCEKGNRVLIAEWVITEPNAADMGKLLDIEMLLYLTGRERTVQEYSDLLGAAGFEYSGITPTDSVVSVVEGVYAG
jgi:hypothetical protein